MEPNEPTAQGEQEWELTDEELDRTPADGRASAYCATTFYTKDSGGA